MNPKPKPILRPFFSVFSLPKTHVFVHENAHNNDHLKFHIWSLSFFRGIRLTTESAGFLDATPINPGKLVDFHISGEGLLRSVKLAEKFWIDNLSIPRQIDRFAAAVNALFMAQYPRALEFEQFLYLNSALDSCCAISKAIQPPSQPPSQAGRTEWLCKRLNIEVPRWATAIDPTIHGKTEVGDIRNDAIHEALYMDEPFGFALHKPGDQHLILELQAVICRALVALIGGTSIEYVRSPINTQQMHGLNL